MTRYLILLLLVNAAGKITAQAGSSTTTVELVTTATTLEPSTTTEEPTSTTTTLEPTPATEKPATTTEEPTTTTTTLEPTTTTEEPATTTEEPTLTTTTLEPTPTTEEPVTTTEEPIATTTTLEPTTTTEEPATTTEEPTLTTTTLEPTPTTDEPVTTTEEPIATTTTLEPTTTTEEPATTTETTKTTSEPTTTTGEPTATTTTLEPTTTTEEPITTTTMLEPTMTIEEPTKTTTLEPTTATTTMETATTTTEEPLTTTITAEPTTTTTIETTATTTMEPTETTATTVEPTTTTTTIETTTMEKPMKQINASECGIRFGCFRRPENCIGVDCEYLITYKAAENMPEYVDISMTTTWQWIGLGHNMVPTMIGMTGVICYKYNNDVMVTSFMSTKKERPALKSNLTEGTMLRYKSYGNGMLHCSFRRRVTVPQSSEMYMLDLSENQHALWAVGGIAGDNLPAKHQYIGTTPQPIDIRFMMNARTTAVTTTTTMKPVDANQCGASLGCFRQPQGCTDDCQLLITYVVAENMPGYVDFTMTTTAKWIALGHNGVSLMAGAAGVICYKYGNDVKVTSFRATDRIRPTFNNNGLVAGTKLLYKSYQSGQIFCSFRRKVMTPSGSEMYMLNLLQNQHAIWAMGPLAGDNLPGKHTFRAASGKPIDIRFMGATGGDLVRSPQLYTLVLSLIIGVLYQFYHSD